MEEFAPNRSLSANFVHVYSQRCQMHWTTPGPISAVNLSAVTIVDATSPKKATGIGILREMYAKDAKGEIAA